MSDPHGHGDSKSGGTFNPVRFFSELGIVGVGLLFFALYFYYNEQQANNFILILHVVQFIFAIILAFMINKLWFLMKEFSKNGAAMVKYYEDQVKHHHHHVDEDKELKQKYELAVKHLESDSAGEWKIGLVELDNFIRMALIERGYVGETTLDLIDDAKSKNHKHIEDAENIALVRQLLKSQGPRFNYSKDNVEKLLKRFEHFVETIIPHTSHEEHAHDNGHH